MYINYFTLSKTSFTSNHRKQNAICKNTNSNDTFIKNNIEQNSIKNDKEYNQTLEKIYSYKNKLGKPIYNYQQNITDYPKATKDEEGLLLYAGSSDIHDDINRYLSNRPMKELDIEISKDIINVIDYALNKLDKKYGKYSGIVYRQGIIPENNKQYISTTTCPDIAATLYGGACILNNLDFAIIKTKNGHKINEFQRDMESDYAEEEEEILLPRTSEFREIKSPQGELLKEKNNFVKILEMYAHKSINSSKVKVYEEK